MTERYWALLGLCMAVAPMAWAIPEGPEPNTPEWVQREATNYAKTLEAPAEQLAPAFAQRLAMQSFDNQLSYIMRAAGDPSWVGPTPLNTEVTPLCASWMLQCAGDPFRYPGVDAFYDTADVTPVVFYDAGCARLSGRVWLPKTRAAGQKLPGVIIETGSIQAPETLYWWMAQALVRSGYAVMTFDVRGQGRSDQQTPAGEQGSNFNSAVFWDGLVNVVDFFRSTVAVPYPHNQTCAGTYPTVVTDFNPIAEHVDFSRLGLVGHSLGASGVSIVQSYGAPGAHPWPGLLDVQNPVTAIVAWDSLSASAGDDSRPAAIPRVPAMGHTSEYGIAGTPMQNAPDPDNHKGAFNAWREAGLPVYQLTIQGSTHFEWSLIPTFPATSWCPTVGAQGCEGGYGRPLAEHYSVAWLDRWMKKPGEIGFDDADARLLADADWVERYSFYSRSARSFSTRDGRAVLCEDIRAGCSTVPGSSTGGGNAGGGNNTPVTGARDAELRGPALQGGALSWSLLLMAALVAALRRVAARTR